MFRFILTIGLLISIISAHQAQNYSKELVGQWEDKASNNNHSFQWHIKKDMFARLKIDQANLIDMMDSVFIPYEKNYRYEWVNETMIRYAKLPNKNPVKAEQFPPTHSLIRINKLEGNDLEITICDIDWKKEHLDSVIANNNALDTLFGNREVSYRRLDLQKEENKALFMGLWRDPISDKEDTLEYQLFIQKTQLGFLKLNKEEQKQPTTLKPNKRYYYEWLSDKVICYHKEKATGFTAKKEKDPNPYKLMRIDHVNKKDLVLTLSTRSFNKEGLEYIKKEDNFDLYFAKKQLSYGRINIVKEKCKGTEVVTIGGKSVIVEKKPIIYLYPEIEQEVKVLVNFKGQFTHTYPKYNPAKGWTMIASPDGTLTDPVSKKQYYALYWEGANHFPFDSNEGFLIKGEESASFLEEKCAQLGLNPREANEFIIYWLPLLEKNPYNFIHFSTQAYQDQAPMEITPQPDALIRVFMLYKGLEEPILVKEQKLPSKPQRKGFTVVEWGGAELGQDLNEIK